MSAERKYDLEDRLIRFAITKVEEALVECNQLIAIFTKSLETANKNKVSAV